MIESSFQMKKKISNLKRKMQIIMKKQKVILDCKQHLVLQLKQEDYLSIALQSMEIT